MEIDTFGNLKYEDSGVSGELSSMEIIEQDECKKTQRGVSGELSSMEIKG